MRYDGSDVNTWDSFLTVGTAGASLDRAPRPDRDDGAPAEAAAPFRGRLLEGLAASIRERGFRETRISDIVRHAHTSRRTFYAEFPTKDACFVELLKATNRVLRHRIAAAVDTSAPWETQVRQAVQAYMDTVAAEPEITLSWIREAQALGAASTRRIQRDAVDSVLMLVQELTGNGEMRRSGTRQVTRPLALMLFGGLRELTATVVEDGGDVRDVTEIAVEAVVALLRPPPDGTPGTRPAAASRDDPPAHRD